MVLEIIPKSQPVKCPCPIAASNPSRLISGLVVCEPCPLAAHERGTRIRHLDNLQRLSTKQERIDYLNGVAAQEGAGVASDARVALALAWDEARKKDCQ